MPAVAAGFGVVLAGFDCGVAFVVIAYARFEDAAVVLPVAVPSEVIAGVVGSAGVAYMDAEFVGVVAIASAVLVEPAEAAFEIADSEAAVAYGVTSSAVGIDVAVAGVAEFAGNGAFAEIASAPTEYGASVEGAAPAGAVAADACIVIPPVRYGAAASVVTEYGAGVSAGIECAAGVSAGIEYGAAVHVVIGSGVRGFDAVVLEVIEMDDAVRAVIGTVEVGFAVRAVFELAVVPGLESARPAYTDLAAEVLTAPLSLPEPLRIPVSGPEPEHLSAVSPEVGPFSMAWAGWPAWSASALGCPLPLTCGDAHGVASEERPNRVPWLEMIPTHLASAYLGCLQHRTSAAVHADGKLSLREINRAYRVWLVHWVGRLIGR